MQASEIGKQRRKKDARAGSSNSSSLFSPSAEQAEDKVGQDGLCIRSKQVSRGPTPPLSAGLPDKGAAIELYDFATVVKSIAWQYSCSFGGFVFHVCVCVCVLNYARGRTRPILRCCPSAKSAVSALGGGSCVS